MESRRIAELRRECLKASQPVADLLNVAATAAAALADEDALGWMNEEIHGYALPERVPSYRNVDVQPLLIIAAESPRLVGWTNAALPSNRTRVLRASVPHLERTLTVDASPYILRQPLAVEFVNASGVSSTVQRVEGAISRETVISVLTQVRRRLLEWTESARSAHEVQPTTRTAGEDVAHLLFDAELRERCADLLLKFQTPEEVHRLDTVIMEATKILETRIRTLVGSRLPDDEKNLMGAVFGGDPPLIRLSEHKGEQDAGHLLFRGAYGFIRNPFHHRLVRIDRPERAVQMVMLVDYLLHLLESAEAPTAKS